MHIAWTLVFAVLAVAVTNAQECRFCRNQRQLCQANQKGGKCGRYIRGGVFGNDINVIVNTHNKLRRRVASGQERRGRPGPQPRATNMQTMKWDAGLAQAAQRWADQCDFSHSCIQDGRFSVGQNLAWSGSSNVGAGPDWKGLIESWYNEVAKYSNRDVNTVRFSMGTGHYTQVVWANTYLVGCGYASYKQGGRQWFSRIYVCNYGPAGNVRGQAIYNVE